MGVAENEDDVIDSPESVDAPDSDEVVDPPQGDPADPPNGDEDEDEEVVAQFGDEEPPASEEKQEAPAWVKDLRHEQKRLRKENAELKAKLGTNQPVQKGKPELPPKPKLADFDYDEEKYEQARDAWDGKKREIDSWEATQAERARQEQEAVRQVHENYAKSKAELKVKDYQDAEEEAVSQLSTVQQSILMAGAKNPAAMVYALGKNPAKLKELASIKDPVKFAVTVGELQKDLKVTKRASTKPEPEKTVRSNTSAPASTATLDRLRAEADRTGDRTKVVAYMREQKNAGK